MMLEAQLLDEETERMTDSQIRNCDLYLRELSEQKEKLEERKKEISSTYASQIKQLNNQMKILTRAASQNDRVILHDAFDDQEIEKILSH